MVGEVITSSDGVSFHMGWNCSLKSDTIIFVLRAHKRVNVGLRVNMAMLGYVDDGLSSLFGTLLILRYPLHSYLSNPRKTHPFVATAWTDFQVF